MGKLRFRRLRPAIVMALTLAAGCATIDGMTPTEGVKAGIERWDCGDIFDGCGWFSTDCVTLTTNLSNGTGEVKFSDFVESARFRIEGIDRRWDWCLADDNFYYCSFKISVDGWGRYFNFRASEDGLAKPTDIFKCTKR